MGSSFVIEIPNLAALRNALALYPAIAQPVLQKAVEAALAVLGKNTTPQTVPVRTGYLVQNWGADVGLMQASWYPKAAYAKYVEFGTAPHFIVAKNRRVLANTETGQIFGPVVNHPGTAANPFMERIMAASQEGINAIFETALQQITETILTA